MTTIDNLLKTSEGFAESWFHWLELQYFHKALTAGELRRYELICDSFQVKRGALCLEIATQESEALHGIVGFYPVHEYAAQRQRIAQEFNKLRLQFIKEIEAQVDKPRNAIPLSVLLRRWNQEGDAS